MGKSWRVFVLLSFCRCFFFFFVFIMLIFNLCVCDDDISVFHDT
jgi:hypothetical protein